MKSYDEIANGLFERRDEYLKEQKVKKSRIKKAVIGTAAVLAIAVIGAGVWKSGMFGRKVQIDSAQIEVKERKTDILTESGTSVQNEKTENNSVTKTEKESVSKKYFNNNYADSASTGGDSSEGVITKSESDSTYGMPCYVMPENGAYSLSYPVQWSVNKYGSEKKYQLSVTIVKNGDGVGDAEKSKELKRLKDAGCDVKKYTLWTYAGEDAHKEYYTQIGGVFTKEQLETLFTGRKYGYFFDFMNNGDSSPAEVADGTEFFEKTTKKGENYISEYN